MRKKTNENPFKPGDLVKLNHHADFLENTLGPLGTPGLVLEAGWTAEGGDYWEQVCVILISGIKTMSSMY